MPRTLATLALVMFLPLFCLLCLAASPQEAAPQPKGRVEGVVRIGAKPAAGVDVKLSRHEPGVNAPMRVPDTSETDKDGKYSFGNVEPGEWQVGIFKTYETRNEKWSSPTATMSHTVIFSLAPGETKQVEIGGTGRPVVGRLVPSKACKVKLAYQGCDFRIIATQNAPIPYPEELDAIQRNVWLGTWLTTADGKAWRRLEHHYVVDIDENGRFHVNDIPAGDYVLMIDVAEWSSKDPSPPAGGAYSSFTMPEIPGGRSDEPLDLGEVVVRMKGEEDVAPSGLFRADAKPERLVGGFAFTEGPACDAQGNVYFTDQPNDQILRWSVEGELSTWMQPCGRSNGLYFDKEGFLWACADEKNQLWRISPDKSVTVVVDGYEGKLINAPNDVWIHPNGGAYFTDPFYKRDYWNRGPMEQPCQGVYYLAPDHKTLTRVVDDLETPNGIIGTPDGKTLYVADLGAGKTYSYSIQPDGSLAEKRLFCKMGSDGMTLDDQGNVYLTGKGVFAFDKTGKQIEHIEIDEPWTANVCFGGRERNTLFITASTRLYAMHMRVKGAGNQ